MKILITLLIAVFLFLQYKLWFSHNSVAELLQLHKQISAQTQKNEQLLNRNQTLLAEVNDLKSGHIAVEANAREELGMIKEGEQFYQIVPPSHSR